MYGWRGSLENRRKRRFLLHEIVIMPNHFHLLLTFCKKISPNRILWSGV
jgi:REP element-mobilizing transposase RayT